MKKYKIDKVLNGRWAVWYMATPSDKRKLGVWKVIDLYAGTRAAKFAFRWKVKGKDKTQEQLDDQVLGNCIKYFYKSNAFRGTKYTNA